MLVSTHSTASQSCAQLHSSLIYSHSGHRRAASRASRHGLHCTAGLHRRSLSSRHYLYTARQALIGALSSQHCLRCTAGSHPRFQFHSAVAVVHRPVASGSWDPRDGSTPGMTVPHHLPQFAQVHVGFFRGFHPAISSSDSPLPPSSALTSFPASGMLIPCENRGYYTEHQ